MIVVDAHSIQLRASTGDYVQPIDTLSIPPDPIDQFYPLQVGPTPSTFNTFVNDSNTIGLFVPGRNHTVTLCSTCLDASSGWPTFGTKLMQSPLDGYSFMSFVGAPSPISGVWTWDGVSQYEWSWAYGADWGHTIPDLQPLLPTFADGSFIRFQASTGDVVTECTNCVGVSESVLYAPASSVQRNVFQVVFGPYPLKMALVAWNGNYLTPDGSQTIGTSSTYFKTLVESSNPYYWSLSVQASTITLYSAERNAYLGTCTTCFTGSNIVAAVVGLNGTEPASFFTPIIESVDPRTGNWVYDYWANAYRWTWANGGSWGTAVPASPNLPTVLPFPHATGQFVNIQDASGRYLGICPTCTTPTGIFASAFESEVVNFFEVFHVYFIFSNIIL